MDPKKKIMALAMVILLALPSLTIPVVAGEEDMADAITRARLYLNKVRTLAENLALEDPEMFQEYLDEIYGLLGRYEGEEPEILYQLDKRGAATAELSDVEPHSGTYSVHLETTGTPKDGDEARIIISMPEGFTLGELETLSWWEYLVTGYPPHVDVYLELGEHDDSLNFEYAYNDVAQRYPGAGMPYGALMDDWFKTFSDDGKGPVKINDDALAWPNSGPAGPPDSIELHTLADWKEGITYTTDFTRTINTDSIVTKLEIEVDNWVVQTEAYVDDIKIDGVTYNFEEEEGGEAEEGLAKDYLDQASAYLGESDFRSAARCLSLARNILGRVKGLLNSMVKIHKVARTEKFEEKYKQKFKHRMERLEDKMNKLKGPKPK